MRRRCSSTDGHTARRPGHAVSQAIRKQIEKVSGWIKQGTGLRQTRHRGLARVGRAFTLAAAYNLIRPPRLLAGATP